MNFDIYAYWNTVELATVFNAIAAITGNGDFNGLLRTLALVAILSMVIVALGGRGRIDDFWKWVVVMAFLHGVLLVPKSTVVIHDRTGTSPDTVVSNVPLGVAFLASGTSHIGDWLTTAFETVFSLPDDVQLRKNGTLFGHRVMLERFGTQFASPILMSNLDEFYRECVIPDLANGQINPNDIANSNNIWAVFNNTNPGLLVTIADYNDPSSTSTVSCPTGYTMLTSQLALDSDKLLQFGGSALYPSMGAAAAKAAYSNALTTTTQFLVGDPGTPASENIKQAALCNYIVDAPARTAAKMGDAAQVQQATATAAAIRDFKASTMTMYNVAASGMPKFRNAIELVCYAVSPFILLIAIVAGQYGMTFLKAYAGSLLWVQLWPPLYAVMNFVMNSKAAQQMGSVVTATGNAPLACGMTHWLGGTAVDDMTVAGYLTLSIPVIAWGLVQGTMSAAQSAAGAWTQASGQTGTEMLGKDNMRLDQHTVGVTSANQYNTAPTVRTGAPVHTAVGANGVNVTTFADGTAAVDASGMQHRMNLRLNAGSRMSAALQQQSEQAQTAAVGQVVSAGETTAAALQQSADLIRTRAKGERAGTHYGVGDQAGFSQAVTDARTIARAFEERHGLKEGMGAMVLGELGASGGIEVLGTGVKATLKAQGKSDAEITQILGDAKTTTTAKEFRAAMDRVHKTSRDVTFDSTGESGRRAMQGIRANLDQSRQHAEQASASNQRSLALKDAATRARENSGAWETGLLRQFTDWMGTQYNTYAGRNFDGATVAQTAEKNPELLTPFVERFFKERVEPTLSAGVGQVTTEGDVRAFFERGKAAAPTAGDVAAQGGQWLGQVKGAAAGATLDPNAVVASQLPQQVAWEIGGVEQAIAGGKGKVEAQSKPVEQKVTSAVENPGSLAAIAASNATTAVLPQGTTYLADKVGLVPEHAAFAKKEAETYKGDVKDALIDTAVFGVTTVAGGALGRTVGNGVGAAAEKVAAEKFAAAETSAGAKVAAARESAVATDQAANRLLTGADGLSDRSRAYMEANLKEASKDAWGNVANVERAAQAEAKAAKDTAWREMEATTEKAPGSGTGAAIGAEGSKALAESGYGHEPLRSTVDAALNAGAAGTRAVEGALDRGEQNIGEVIGTRATEGAMAPPTGELPHQMVAQEVGTPLTGSPGQSNLGKVFGEPRKAPTQVQEGNDRGGQVSGGDTPPPSGR